MTIYLLRGTHANEYELQNYYPLSSTHDICVVTTRRPLTPISLPTTPLFSPADLPSFPLRRQILNRLIGGEQWLLGLEKLVTPIDILHTAETYTPYTHQAVQLRRAGKVARLVCTCWETIPHNNEKLARLKSWKKDAYQYVDIFHTPTHRAKAALVAEGVKPHKIKVISYGVDQARFVAGKRTKHSKPVILTVARTVSEKGYDIWHTIRKNLGSLAEMRWVSDVPYDHIPDLYHSADIFLLPSQSTATWEEQYGMVLVEAMSAGLPIVTTRSGAIPEVVGDAALIAASDSVEAITHSLKQILKDSSLRRSYSISAKKRSRSLATDLVAPKLASLYK